jgi:hypothetical protein
VGELRWGGGRVQARSQAPRQDLTSRRHAQPRVPPPPERHPTLPQRRRAGAPWYGGRWGVGRGGALALRARKSRPAVLLRCLPPRAYAQQHAAAAPVALPCAWLPIESSSAAAMVVHPSRQANHFFLSWLWRPLPLLSLSLLAACYLLVLDLLYLHIDDVVFHL